MVVAKELPRIVLKALEGGEAKVGKILVWVNAAMLAFMTIIFFLTPESVEEKLRVAPVVVVLFGGGVAGGLWLMRKPYRVHRMLLAKVLRDDPGRVASVKEVTIRVGAAGQHAVQETLVFDGEREFAPRSGHTMRILGLITVVQRSMIHIKVKGTLLTRKLVVPMENAPELLSWLFATLAAANPDCVWGTAKISTHLGDR